LNAYFTNLARFVLGGATGLFSGKARAKREKLSSKSWMHDGARVQEVVEACGMQLTCLRQGSVETASAHKLLILLASISAAWRANERGVLPAPRMSKNRHERPQAQ
jgi:hypothetical protein